MTWFQRTRRASYRAPSGRNIYFIYEDMTSTVDLKTHQFVFPEADGSLIQQTATAGDEFPIRAIFNGQNYDLAIRTFMEMLKEPGIGTLNHPIHGQQKVIPTGKVKRKDNRTSASNEGEVLVTFKKTNEALYRAQRRNDRAEIQRKSRGFELKAIEDFANLLNFPGISEILPFLTLLFDTSANPLNLIQEFLPDDPRIKNLFQTFARLLTPGNDNPFLENKRRPIAQAITEVTKLPSPVTTSVLITYDPEILIDEYESTRQEITGRTDQLTPRNEQVLANTWSSALINAQVNTAINSQFPTRPATNRVARKLQNAFTDHFQWHENYYDATVPEDGSAPINNGPDETTSTQDLQEVVVDAAAHLTEISFAQPAEQRLILTRPRTLVDLTAQLYKRVDDETLNFMIDTNELVGQEILEIPKGREILYYPD